MVKSDLTQKKSENIRITEEIFRQIAKEIINLFDFCPLILYNSLSTKPILMGYNLEL